MTDPDRLREHEERLRAMLTDRGETWDLSPKDRAAIKWVLRERDELIHDIERHIAIASREAEARVAAEKRADEAYERAAQACENVGKGWAPREWLRRRVEEECAAAIRALSPLTALPQTQQHETAKHETAGNED